MKWAGYTQLALSKLKLPGDIKERMGRPRVADLARSIELLGDEPINALAVERDGLVLLAGRDRVAALMRLGLKKAWCHMATDVSDQDRLDLEIDENLHRRQDNRDDLIARRVKKVEGELPDNLSANSEPRRGPKKTAKGAAREQVARELGTTPEAVRAAEKRADADTTEGFGVDQIDRTVAPPVETWGVPVGHLAQEFASVRIAQEAMRAADRLLQQAQGKLAALKDGGGIAGQLYSRLYGGIHSTAAQLRASIPVALCPYCKGLPQRRVNCGGCGALGYVGEDALLGVAEELRISGPHAMVPDGRGGFMPVVVFRERVAEPEPKKLQIQDAEGNPIAVADEDEGCPF